MMQFTIAVGSFKNGNMKDKHWKKILFKEPKFILKQEKALKGPSLQELDMVLNFQN